MIIVKDKNTNNDDETNNTNYDSETNNNDDNSNKMITIMIITLVIITIRHNYNKATITTIVSEGVLTDSRSWNLQFSLRTVSWGVLGSTAPC